MGALNLPSASDVERLTRRLRSVSQRLEGIEDVLDRLEGVLGRFDGAEQLNAERLGAIEARLGALVDEVAKFGASAKAPTPAPKRAPRKPAAAKTPGTGTA
jgi:hypothetical protein